jgi:transmembrane sensor
MPPVAPRFPELIDKYLHNRASLEETQELFLLLQSGLYDEELEQHIAGSWDQEDQVSEQLNDQRKKQILTSILTSSALSGEADKPRGFLYRYRWLAAACLVLIIALAFFGPFRPAQHDPLAITGPYKIDSTIRPGTTQALLTLDDGSLIVLNDKPKGELARQGAASVIKQDSATLGYQGQTGSVAFNTLHTPRGGQYNLVLNDGSKVWLNAATTLRFPVSFNGNDRTVELDGEAYFEVAHDAQKPFYVKMKDGSKVEVTGTRFNVMAYEDELTKEATLLEGAINISTGNVFKKVQPGQQAVVASDNISVINKTDPEESIAWKNGFISFRDADIKTIMRAASRWYDVNVEYQGEIPSRIFTGSLLRSASLTDLLHILELSKIRFKIEGRKIIVIG